jgi:hypothetical protein
MLKRHFIVLSLLVFEFMNSAYQSQSSCLHKWIDITPFFLSLISPLNSLLGAMVQTSQTLDAGLIPFRLAKGI